MGFALTVLIPDVGKFIADPAHAGICTGSVWADSITGGTDVPVSPPGSISIFDGGVRPNHELGMECDGILVRVSSPYPPSPYPQHTPSKCPASPPPLSAPLKRRALRFVRVLCATLGC